MKIEVEEFYAQLEEQTAAIRANLIAGVAKPYRDQIELPTLRELFEGMYEEPLNLWSAFILQFEPDKIPEPGSKSSPSDLLKLMAGRNGRFTMNSPQERLMDILTPINSFVISYIHAKPEKGDRSNQIEILFKDYTTLCEAIISYATNQRAFEDLTPLEAHLGNFFACQRAKATRPIKVRYDLPDSAPSAPGDC